MEAAFTVMVIFTISTILVRIASTIMRLTGLPDNVARFQSLSAMTGTGFTTRESELIVNYPIRRRDPRRVRPCPIPQDRARCGSHS